MAFHASHRPPAKGKTSSCRMFDTPLIEFFSHIHPASPFVFWLPVLAAIGWWTVAQGLSPILLLALMATGWLCWTLAEYLLHRFVFHWIGPKGWHRRFHFIFHGVHHDYPQDAKRLVMPLGVSIPLGLVFFLAVDALLPRSFAYALFIGFGIGYLFYDGIHYFTHHLPAKRRLGKFLKRYHLVHHHTGVEGKWGVSSPIWDYVFRSQDDVRAR
jgi:sterol desaturase/sphingolipid hydroxylase (fatty acid hydroxylase superfamily)